MYRSVEDHKRVLDYLDAAHFPKIAEEEAGVRSGTLNVMTGDGTITAALDLDKLGPEVGSYLSLFPDYLVFLELPKKLVIYSLGSLDRPDLVLPEGRPKTRIQTITLLAQRLTVEKVMGILSQFPNLTTVTVQLFNFGETQEGVQLNPFLGNPRVRSLAIKTKFFMKAEVAEGCGSLIEAFAAHYKGIMKLNLELPYDKRLMERLEKLINNSPFLNGVNGTALISRRGAKKIYCHAPHRVQKELNPVLMELLGGSKSSNPFREAIKSLVP